MTHTPRLLQLLMHPDPVARQQGHELLAALPEVIEELCGPEGILWDGTAAGVLQGLELLVRLTQPDGPDLWNIVVKAMSAAGPLPWQSRSQHREDLLSLQQWEPEGPPPASLRDISRRGLWMLRRHCEPIESAVEQSPWLRAQERLHDLQFHLSTLEFLTDTLDDSPEPDEIGALQDELQSVGEQVRQPLAELLLLVHLLRAESAGSKARAARWHSRHLAPLLIAALRA